MSNKRKFTIIIPTRDRVDVLRYALGTAITQDYENFEVIVSDNSSNDNTFEVVSRFDDERIKYVNTGERLSMSHNWEFALTHINEGWVTILGDDDAMLPGALARANQIIDETNTQALRSDGCSFYWPSLMKSDFGFLRISLKKNYMRINSEKALGRVINGSLSYRYLPMLYTGGFVDFDLVKEAKAVSKKFYLSMTPDVYSAILFSKLTEEYVYSFEPLALNGASHHSGGTAAFKSSQGTPDYTPAEKFFSEKNIPFHPSLPLSDDGKPPISLQALVYEAYLQATPFIKTMDANARPERQLELILLRSSTYRAALWEWGKKFAALHNLNFEKILKRSRAPRTLLVSAARRNWNRLDSLFNDYTVRGNMNLPLKNCWEASIVAGVIKLLRPNRVRNVINRIDHHLRLKIK